jgi:hypothetical protein
MTDRCGFYCIVPCVPLGSGQCQTHACGSEAGVCPNNAPRSISLSSPRGPPVAPALFTELFLCRHKYGVSPGDGVSRPCNTRPCDSINKVLIICSYCPQHYGNFRIFVGVFYMYIIFFLPSSLNRRNISNLRNNNFFVNM